MQFFWTVSFKSMVLVIMNLEGKHLNKSHGKHGVWCASFCISQLQSLWSAQTQTALYSENVSVMRAWLYSRDSQPCSQGLCFCLFPTVFFVSNGRHTWEVDLKIVPTRQASEGGSMNTRKYKTENSPYEGDTQTAIHYLFLGLRA